MSNPRVSVVIPNFNYGQFLSEALDSVLNQSFTDYEVLIIDNFSTDGSREVVRSKNSSKLTFVQFENRGSIAAARNKGLSIARGQYIAFLDSDDYWLRTKLEMQVPLMMTSDISYHNLKLFGQINGRNFRGWDLGPTPLIKLLSGGNPIATSSVLANKSALLELGGFPENQELFAVEDFALWLKCADAGLQFRHLDAVLGGYRIHSGASSTTDAPSAVERLIDEYRSLLNGVQIKRAEAFISYAKGVRLLGKGESSKARQEFSKVVLNGDFRFRWRGLLRYFQSFLQPFLFGMR